jgi:hypothetical protein
MSKARPVGIAWFLGIYLLFCSGCVYKVPLSPNVPNLQLGKKLPLEAALLITEETRNYIFKGKPDTFAGSGFSYEIALGEALEKASIGIFSQIFDKITLVRTREEAKKYKIFIEPKVEDYHFRFAASFLTVDTVYSKIRIQARVASRDVNIEEESDESPEYEGRLYGKNALAGTASAALVHSLGTIAIKISEDASVRKIIEYK